MEGKYLTRSGAFDVNFELAFKSATDTPLILINNSNFTRLNPKPSPGEEKLTAAPAVHPRPAPDNVTISLAFDGTTKVGVNVKDIVTPVAPLITLLNVTAGALLPRDPSTMAGNVPVKLDANTPPSNLVKAHETPVKAPCAAVGFVTRNENAMAEPPLKVPAVSVTVNTCEALMLALPAAPEDGDAKLRAPLFTLKPTPESVKIIFPCDGIVVLGVTDTFIVTRLAPLIVLLRVNCAGLATWQKIGDTNVNNINTKKIDF